ncbi:MAG: bifunctional nuclease family protein [Lachnospiraceae bacterium]|nr:bifunctional nuclease family protein [Prevotella sp.]MCM1075219.1 bifunctional nuclease family protein [Ruminococcus sp.]MCM1224577.1 bifunctional nuclease family protein [Lachnospiraceae bacterium]
MDKDYKRMLVVGITYNKVERGVYALILQELGGTRRLPIVIGMAEAQSIECKLQEIITPRPLTHDLMANILRAFGLELKYVVIKVLDGGIFAADLHLSNGERTVVMDSRSSDGISLALRMGVPIFASEDLLNTMGMDSKVKSQTSANVKITEEKREDTDDETFWQNAQSFDGDKLQNFLDRFVEQEEYEKAARIRDILAKRDENPFGE